MDLYDDKHKQDLANTSKYPRIRQLNSYLLGNHWPRVLQFFKRLTPMLEIFTVLFRPRVHMPISV